MAPSFSIHCPNSSYSSLSGVEPGLRQNRHHQLSLSNISYNTAPDSVPSTLFFGSSSSGSAPLGLQKHNGRKHAFWKIWSQSKEVGGEAYLNSPPVLETATISTQEKDELLGKSNVGNVIPDGSSISAFMTQVRDIVKLVDSLDDVSELHLKQQGCEVIIKKKEAFQTPPPQISYSHPPPSLPSPAISPATSPRALPSPPPTAGEGNSSYNSLKCPMAGTFYRSPGPGKPMFVKVGDKVEKGQVVCIIEAMKLMNEIEADQSGTIAEVLAEDAKPVSIDTTLFLIKP